MPQITVGAHDVSYREEGAGEVALLLHSGGLGARQWARLVGPLSATHRVVAPDLIGTGGTSGVSGDAAFHFHEDVDLVAGLLDALSIERAHVVGHSYGGLVGLTLARRDLSRVRSLALFEPVAFGVLYSNDDAAAIRDLEGENDDGRFIDDATGGDATWLQRFIDWWQGPGAWDAMSAGAREAFQRVGRKVYQEVRSLTADRTPHDAYAALDVPALLMTATRSPLAARRVVEVLGDALPDATVRRFEGAGHMAPLTHGGAVNAAILEHLRHVDAAPT